MRSLLRRLAGSVPVLAVLLAFSLASGDALAQRSSRSGSSRSGSTTDGRSQTDAEKKSSSETKSSTKSSQEQSSKKQSSKKQSSKKSGQKRSQKKPAKKASGPVSVPIDIGFGPQLLVPNPPLFFEQPLFAALNISVAAVIDKQLIERHKNQIPKEYRDAAGSVGEVRYRPLWLALVPSTIVISPDVIPGVTTTGMYGATWRPLGIGVDLLREPVRFNVHADLALTYLFLHSQLREPTHFLRPGVTLSAMFEVPLTDTFLVSLGWMSDLYIPQPLSQPPWTIFPLEDSLWHLGGPFVKLHIRIPYEVSL